MATLTGAVKGVQAVIDVTYPRDNTISPALDGGEVYTFGFPPLRLEASSTAPKTFTATVTGEGCTILDYGFGGDVNQKTITLQPGEQVLLSGEYELPEIAPAENPVDVPFTITVDFS